MEGLTELESRILTELEEAGQEDIDTLINTCMVVKGEASEIDETKIALNSLVSKGLVSLATSLGPNNRLAALPSEAALQIVAEIETCLTFNSVEDHWLFCAMPKRTDEAAPRVRCPNVVSTDEGHAEAQSILEARGYRWWS